MKEMEDSTKGQCCGYLLVSTPFYPMSCWKSLRTSNDKWEEEINTRS